MPAGGCWQGAAGQAAGVKRLTNSRERESNPYSSVFWVLSASDLNQRIVRYDV